MKDDYATNSHYVTYAFSLLGVKSSVALYSQGETGDSGAAGPSGEQGPQVSSLLISFGDFPTKGSRASLNAQPSIFVRPFLILP